MEGIDEPLNFIWPSNNMKLRILIFFTLLVYVTAIFEDQVGKFDWHKELIGCPSQVSFDYVNNKPVRLIVTTKESVVASLAPNTGGILWRRILEDSLSESANIVSAGNEEYLFTVTNDGRSIRVWRRSDGILVLQFPISVETSKRHALHIHGNTILVSTGKRLLSFSINGEQLESHLFPNEKAFSSFLHWHSDVVHVSENPESTNLEVVHIDEQGKIGPVVNLNFTVYDNNRCHSQSSYVTCFEGRSLTIANVRKLETLKLVVDFEITNVFGLENVLIVLGKSKLELFEISGGNIHQKNILDINSVEKLGLVDSQFFVLVSDNFLRLISLKDGQVVFGAPLPKAVRAPPKFIFARRAAELSPEFEIVIVGKDCRVEMVSVDISTKLVNIEWAKEESLINAASVEMVDLPLSESQQMIEDEFEEEDKSNIFSAFARRIQVQFDQFCRLVTKNLEKSFHVVTSVYRHGNGLSDFINSIRSTTNSIGIPDLFERDYFNLRKVVIVTSTDGTIFGLDSRDGKILWKIWLGDSFFPLVPEFDNRRVPLFVQRTTAHYQLYGLASVAYSDKFSQNGMLVSFNPMFGEIVSKQSLGYPIKRIFLLPVTDHKHVHPVVTIGAGNQIDITPTITSEQLETCASLYLMDITATSKVARGLKIDLAAKKIKVVWSGSLGLGTNDKILSVKGKPYNHKVHSQGRVLVTREVQYKYVNPNLVAVASLDKISQHLSVVLVDIVTGQIVHSASVAKTAEPVHLVHSENWVAYSYWSEKGRRTELGIIELYEGSEIQSQKKLFDSKLLDREPPIVLAQSYIYAQGVEAMSISETEQGLTTRSILLALPSGNIHEVSRRLLDATRPLDVTQAMREEMIIGYMPEIAVGTEEMINYNQTIHRVRGIKTSPSGLESTSLVLAYGTDLFFTRLVPSGTFDILKDDFDHVLISIVLAGLILGSYIAKRWARSNTLAAQWS